MEITQQQLKEILHYDPETGIFRWRHERVNGQIKPWTIAGNIQTKGYVMLCINYIRHLGHRLAWLYMTGNWPTKGIDHIDGNRSNNKFTNLREATCKENCENRGLSKTNKSGFRGVNFHPTSKKWLARVGHNYKQVYIGLFDTAEEANIAAIAKRAELFTHDTGRDQLNTFG